MPVRELPKPISLPPEVVVLNQSSSESAFGPATAVVLLVVTNSLLSGVVWSCTAVSGSPAMAPACPKVTVPR